VSGREVVRAPERAGWEVRRVRGGHHSVKGPDGRRSTVPVHGNRTVPLWTIDGIIEDAGLTVEQFLDLLGRRGS
jgi:predicted RNA binding protein YcfA (HicA-like mRNA interferase family)